MILYQFTVIREGISLGVILCKIDYALTLESRFSCHLKLVQVIG